MSQKSGLVVIALALGVLLLTAARIEGGVLDASWTAPTTNTDGSALTTLALYRLYYGYYTSESPCPGSTFVEVASSTPAPQPGDTVSIPITGLDAGAIYSVSVTAVDTSGNESDCSDLASAVARDDFDVTPTTP
jgi:hypothetical protein